MDGTPGGRARLSALSAARQAEKSTQLGLERARREQETAAAQQQIDELQLELGNKGQDFRRLQVRGRDLRGASPGCSNDPSETRSRFVG